jgi:hypothetical protein
MSTIVEVGSGLVDLRCLHAARSRLPTEGTTDGAILRGGPTRPSMGADWYYAAAAILVATPETGRAALTQADTSKLLSDANGR